MSKRRKKLRDIPGTLAWASKLAKGHGQFIMHLKEMRDSLAMQNMPLREWKLLLLFETTHLENKGECNGELILPYRQAQMAGIHKDGIGPAFKGLIKRKLLVRTREGSYRSNTRSLAATYRLTYLPARKPGSNQYEPPTHDWRDYKAASDTVTKEVELSKHRAALPAEPEFPPENQEKPGDFLPKTSPFTPENRGHYLEPGALSRVCRQGKAGRRWLCLP